MYNNETLIHPQVAKMTAFLVSNAITEYYLLENIASQTNHCRMGLGKTK